MISPNPVTIQLRYLQSLSEVSANPGSTIVFPLPLDLLRPLLEPGDERAAKEAPEEPAEPPAPRLPRPPDAAVRGGREVTATETRKYGNSTDVRQPPRA